MVRQGSSGHPVKAQQDCAHDTARIEQLSVSAMGARQFVVHDAANNCVICLKCLLVYAVNDCRIISCRAEITTFLAPAVKMTGNFSFDV